MRAAGNQRSNHKLSLVAGALLVPSRQIGYRCAINHILGRSDDLASRTFAIFTSRDVKIDEHREHGLDGDLSGGHRGKRTRLFCHSISPSIILTRLPKASRPDLAAVIEQPVADIFPNRVRPVELDRIQALDLDATVTASAFDPQ
jgi:hypothetical protein